MRYLSKQKWSEAIKYAKRSSDPVALKIVLARKFIKADSKDNSFEEIVKFINQNPDWPQMQQIKEAAERALCICKDKKKAVEWFSKNKPMTGRGIKYYAIIAQGVVKDKDKLLSIIRDGWIYGDFSKEEQKDFLAKNGKYLSKEDHFKKVNYLMWKNPGDSNIPMLFGFLDKRDVNLFKASKDPCEMKKIFANYNTENRYPSVLLYSYLRESAKDDIIEDKLGAIASNIQSDSNHASELWKLKAKYARNFIKQKKYSIAYSIAKNNHAISPEDVSDAEFLSGWLALRYLKKPGIALTHFKRVRKVVKQPISVARACYWIARAEMALGNKEEAHEWYRAAAVYNFTFYGQLAGIELGHKTLTLPQVPKVEKAERVRVAKNEIVRAVALLLKNNMDDLAVSYAKAFMGKIKNAADATVMLEYIASKKRINHVVALAKAASYNNILLVHDAFPTKTKIHSKHVEPALAYSIIRQETIFDQYAVSEKDAHGLMQLLPSTACTVAKSLQMKCRPKSHLLSDPHYNITLGTKELKDRLKEFDNSLILTMVAYNAGPHRSNEWIDIYGDPRKLTKRFDVIDWIESIPFYETRNYVQRVLENLQVYRAILGNKKLRMLDDLGVKS
jgi:soluble lytic murein transglycosylase